MRRLSVFVLLVSILATGASAVDTGYAVGLDARIGFGGTFRAGHWTPLELTLQNLGPAIHGWVDVELTRRNRMGPDQQTTTYERRLDLAVGAVKTYSMVLPLETSVYPIRVVIRNDGTTVLDEEVKLSGRSVSGALVVVLSRTPSLDFLLPVFNTTGHRHLNLVYPLVDFLPDQWQGYDGADLLVLHDARVGSLSDRQLDAMRTWVAGGGRLVLSAGAHLGPAEFPIVERLTGLTPGQLEVKSVGSVGLDRLGLPVLASETDAPAVVTSFAEIGAEVSYLPLGRGDIIVLPFDYAQLVRVAPGTSLGMWTAILPESAVLNQPDPGDLLEEPGGIIPISMSRRAFETDLIADQLDLPVYDFPSRALVLGLGTGFVISAMTLLVWLYRRPRGRGTSSARASMAGIAALIALSGLFTLVSNQSLNVRRQPSEALALSLEIAELGPDDGYALVKKDLVLFSRTRADYSIRFAGRPIAVPLDSQGFRRREEDTGYSLQMKVDRWGHSSAVAMQVMPLDIRARVHRGIGYANVELSNRSDVEIRKIVVLANGFPTAMGPLRPGTVTEKVIMGPGVGRWDEIVWEDFVPSGLLAPNRARLLEDLARKQRNSGEEGSQSLIVVGWRPTAMLRSSVSTAFHRVIELNAMVMELPAESVIGERGRS